MNKKEVKMTPKVLAEKVNTQEETMITGDMIKAVEFLKEADEELITATYKLEGAYFALEDAVKHFSDQRLQKLCEDVEEVLDIVRMLSRNVASLLTNYEDTLDSLADKPKETLS